MITFYSGTPGSGKSYHAAYDIWFGLRHKKNFICNFPVNLNNVSKSLFGSRKLARFDYVTNQQLTVAYLKNYAKKYHSGKKEGETTVVIDEAGIIFNSRCWNAVSRFEWIEFLALHRHYGFNFILISQNDRMIDRQIRGFVEYEIKHRKINNYKLFGAVLGLLSGGSLFICIKYWYAVREKVDSEMMRYRKRVAAIYDTMMLFDRNSNSQEEKTLENQEEKTPEVQEENASVNQESETPEVQEENVSVNQESETPEVQEDETPLNHKDEFSLKLLMQMFKRKKTGKIGESEHETPSI